MRRQRLSASSSSNSDFRMTVTMPPPPLKPIECKPGALQYFCMLTVDTADNAPRICVWIPGLSPKDEVSWKFSGSLSLGSLNTENQDHPTIAGAYAGAAFIGFSNANTDTGTIVFTATVNGVDLDPLSVEFPPACP